MSSDYSNSDDQYYDMSFQDYSDRSDEIMGGEPGEFIQEYDDSILGGEVDSYLDSYLGGGSGQVCAGLIMAFVIFLVIYMIYRKNNKRRYKKCTKLPSYGRNFYMNPSPYDSVLIKPSYFDYNKMGRNYINWA